MNAEILISQPLSRGKSIEIDKQWTTREFRIVMIGTLVHLPLGLALYNAGSLAILHPLLVFALGLYLALNRRVSLVNVGMLAGYIVGSEVLWRMAHIPIYWESGKYMSAAVLALALMKRHRYRFPPIPFVYFLLLVPGCLLTIASVTISEAYSELSSNMSGPLLLVVACWFFHNCRMNPNQLKRLLTAIMLPLFSVAVSTMFYTITNEEIQFSGNSNFATSGGFGPNQVSSMLGLGFFLSLAGLILYKKPSRFTPYFAFAGLFFAAMAVMTFSRGGIYNALGGILILTVFQFRNFSSGVKRTVPALILGGVFFLAIFPYLDSLTEGALGSRFEDTGTTHRWEIAKADIEVFLEGPIFGAGVGGSYESRRQILGFGAMSHTEFTRLVSEHGVFGLAALITLMMMVAANLHRTKMLLGKAFIAGAVAWSGFFMMNSGMRLAAPSFMFGISFLTFVQNRQIRRFIPGAIRVGKATVNPT